METISVMVIDRHDSEQGEFYRAYRRLLSSLKRLIHPLERYTGFTGKEWALYSLKERTELSQRIANYTNRMQDKWRVLESKYHQRRRFHADWVDVNRLRKKIWCLIEELNMSIGSLSQVLHTSGY